MDDITLPVTVTLSGENELGEKKDVTLLFEEETSTRLLEDALPFVHLQPNTVFLLETRNSLENHALRFSASAHELYGSDSFIDPVDIEIYVQSNDDINNHYNDYYIEGFQTSTLDLTRTATENNYTTIVNAHTVMFLGGSGNDGFWTVRSPKTETIESPTLDILKGGAGDDYFSIETTQGGMAWVDGGTGDDIIDTHSMYASFQSTADNSSSILQTLNMGDSLGNLVAYGGEGNDEIFGGRGQDVIFGGIGDDVLQTLGDLNVVKGGDGNDRVETADGSGNILFGNQGSDLLGAVDGDSNVLNGGQGDDDIFSYGDNNVLEGGEDNDFLYIEGNGNMLLGDQGLDRLDAIGDTNVIDGGTEEDGIYVVGQGNIILGGQGIDLIDIMGDTNIIDGGTEEDRIFITGESNTILGGQGSDTLFVKGDRNIIDVGEGEDIAYISGGGNLIKGGEGSDMFFCLQRTEMVDGILDFETGSGGDVLVISDIIDFDAGASVLEDFIRLATHETATIVQVNSDGQGNDFENLVHLEGITGVSLDDLFSHGNIEVKNSIIIF